MRIVPMVFDNFKNRYLSIETIRDTLEILLNCIAAGSVTLGRFMKATRQNYYGD